MSQHDVDSTYGKTVIHSIDRRMDTKQRLALLRWASRLLEIRASRAPALKKARLALDTTYRADILPVVRVLADALKDVVWDDRSWSARLGLGAVAITATTLGGQGAGIAALGTAVGVPLWMVLGAGGSFAGMLVDELQRSLGRTTSGVAEAEPGLAVEAEWSFTEELEPGERERPSAGQPSSDDSGSEPLRLVFRRAYREARARQRAHENASGDAHPCSESSA